MMGPTLFAVLSLCGTSRAAAETAPGAQTLEALRAAPAANGEQVFDGYESRIRTLSPVAYAPLPLTVVPPERPIAPLVSFDAHRVAPGVSVHAPRERPAPASPSRVGGYVAVGLGGAAVAAGLIAGGGLLLPLAAAGAGLIVLGAYLLLR